MTPRSSLACVLLIAAITFWCPAAASPEDRFAAGLAAYRQGDLEDALAHFQSARAAGRRSPSLYYNLGVVAYKLNRLAEARRAFTALTDDGQWRALAHYNLGLVAERGGHRHRAEQHYRRARSLTDSTKLAALADARLATAVPTTVGPGWSGIASIAAGHDDNVILSDQRLLEAISNRGDDFVEALVFSRRSTGDGDRGAALNVGAYYQAHADLDDFDLGALSAAGAYAWPLGSGELTATFKGELLSSGGEGYAGVVTGRLEFGATHGSIRYRLRNDISYVSGFSKFDYVTGWRNRARLELTRRLGSGSIRAGYQAEINDRRNWRSGETFSSYSPRRQELYGIARLDAGPRWTFELRGAVYRSDYANDDRFIAADGEVMSLPRDQDGHQARLRVSFALGQQWSLWAEYQRDYNDSRIERFDYTSNRFLTGLERAF